MYVHKRIPRIKTKDFFIRHQNDEQNPDTLVPLFLFAVYSFAAELYIEYDMYYN